MVTLGKNNASKTRICINKDSTACLKEFSDFWILVHKTPTLDLFLGLVQQAKRTWEQGQNPPKCFFEKIPKINL
jgi:hypothetical protein